MNSEIISNIIPKPTLTEMKDWRKAGAVREEYWFSTMDSGPATCQSQAQSCPKISAFQQRPRGRQFQRVSRLFLLYSKAPPSSTKGIYNIHLYQICSTYLLHNKALRFLGKQKWLCPWHISTVPDLTETSTEATFNCRNCFKDFMGLLQFTHAACSLVSNKAKRTASSRQLTRPGMVTHA